MGEVAAKAAGAVVPTQGSFVGDLSKGVVGFLQEKERQEEKRRQQALQDVAVALQIKSVQQAQEQIDLQGRQVALQEAGFQSEVELRTAQTRRLQLEANALEDAALLGDPSDLADGYWRVLVNAGEIPAQDRRELYSPAKLKVMYDTLMQREQEKAALQRAQLSAQAQQSVALTQMIGPLSTAVEMARQQADARQQYWMNSVEELGSLEMLRTQAELAKARGDQAAGELEAEVRRRQQQLDNLLADDPVYMQAQQEYQAGLRQLRQLGEQITGSMAVSGASSIGGMGMVTPDPATGGSPTGGVGPSLIQPADGADPDSASPLVQQSIMRIRSDSVQSMVANLSSGHVAEFLQSATQNPELGELAAQRFAMGSGRSDLGSIAAIQQFAADSAQVEMQADQQGQTWIPSPPPEQIQGSYDSLVDGGAFGLGDDSRWDVSDPQSLALSVSTLAGEPDVNVDRAGVELLGRIQENITTGKMSVQDVRRELLGLLPQQSAVDSLMRMPIADSKKAREARIIKYVLDRLQVRMPQN